MKPLSPREAEERKDRSIPDFVIGAFNDLIVKNLNLSGEAVIRQEDILRRIMASPDRPREVSRQDLFDNHWMDVEPFFRRAGWTVVYDMPAYCETYEPTFTFRKRGKK